MSASVASRMEKDMDTSVALTGDAWLSERRTTPWWRMVPV